MDIMTVVESQIADIYHQLDVQMQRMAHIQAELDEVRAGPHADGDRGVIAELFLRDQDQREALSQSIARRSSSLIRQLDAPSGSACLAHPESAQPRRQFSRTRVTPPAQ